MPGLKLHIAEHFDAPVWRMEIDSISDILFTEIRDLTTREVSFASISLKTAETYFKNYKADESWLTGMESAYDGVLLLHYYEAKNSPTHKGIAAIDGRSKQLLWSNFIYAFDHLSQNGPVLYDARFQPRKYFLADVRAGAQLRAYSAAMDLPIETPLLLPSPAPFILPEISQLLLEPFGNIVQCLDYNTYRIVSLHTQWAGQLKQLLYIFENGKPVFEDLLNSDIQKMQPESFVLYKDQLIYLKDKTEIKVLNL